MNSNSIGSKSFYSGLGIYTAFIILAILPIFPHSLGMTAAVQFVTAAVVASVLVALARISGVAARLHDPGGVVIQAVFGIVICCGLYSLLTPVSRPELMIMAFLLWTAVALPQLSPRAMLMLAGLFLGAYLTVFASTLLDVRNLQHADAIFMLIVSCVMTGFMYWRAVEYQHAHTLRRTQEASLEEAEARIQEFTTQDVETTALKYAYFRNQLVREKGRIDRIGGTFSAGLIAIDNYDELLKKIGEHATNQVLREFTERATRLIRNTDSHEKWGADYKPLGRMSGGRFGMVLPATEFDAAMKCAETLHSAVDFRAIRTHIGVVGITLSIGVTEYAMPEGVDELMDLAARALKLAQQHNGNDFKGLRRPQRSVKPVKPGLEEWNSHVVNH